MAPGADGSTIKAAYRRLAASVHPDRHGGDGEATERFKVLVEAYSVLADDERRATYDAGQAVKLPIPVEAGSGPAELVGSLVDKLFGVRTKGPLPGDDLRYRLTLTFVERALGGRRELLVPVQERCGTCHGRGLPPLTLPDACERCAGAGELQVRRGLRSVIDDCPDCAGRGYRIDEPCPGCGGGGTVTVRRKVEIEVPPGLAEAEKLLIRGAGQPGRHGGAPGDLYVQISHSEDHPVLQLLGRDVRCERPLPMLDAILGARITVPTIEGTARIQVPRGSRDGAVLRMANFGARMRGEEGRGDQLVTLRLELPTNLDPEQLGAMQALRKRLGADNAPRSTAFEASLGGESDDG